MVDHQALSNIWRAVLPESHVDEDRTFRALGGGSLAAMRAVNRVRREFGVRLPLTLLFEDLTLRDIAHHIGEIAAGKGARP